MYLSCDQDVQLEDGVKYLEEEIKNDEADSLKAVYVKTGSRNCSIDCKTIKEYYISLCREYKLLQNDRITVLSLPDSLLALQLSISSLGKVKEFISFDRVQEMSRLIEKYKMTESEVEIDKEQKSVLDTYQDLLKQSNQCDLTDIYQTISDEISHTGEEESDLVKDLKKTRIFCFGEPTDKMEISMMKLLSFGDFKEVRKDNSGCIVSESRGLTWLNSMNYQIPLSQDTSPSTAQLYIERVFLCYIELLVNTRSELSLATVFNIPDRELGHLAFTALKHTSQQKKLPMYQTAVSHIIKLRLGGKAYAPSLDCELGPFVKGIGELITFVQKLQCIVEEDSDIRSACRKVVVNIKNCIKKCQVRRLKEEDLESVSQSIHNKLTKILDDRDKNSLVSPDKPASDGGSLLGRRTVRVLRQLLDAEAASKGSDSECFLEDFALNPTTPTRIPCLLSQFRSPDPNVILEEKENNEKDKKLKKGLKVRNNIQNYSSVPVPKQLEDEKEEKLLRQNLNSVIVIPSKTIVHAAPGNTGLLLGVERLSSKNKVNPASLDKENMDQPIKRQKTFGGEKVINQSQDVLQKSVEKVTKKATKTKGKPKSCRRKLLPQVKGQQNITSFFRL